MSKLYISLNTPEDYKRNAKVLASAIEAVLYGQGEYNRLPVDKKHPKFLQALRNTNNRHLMAGYIQKTLFNHEREDILKYLRDTQDEFRERAKKMREKNCGFAADIAERKIFELDMLIEAVEYYRHAYEPKTNGSVFDILISEMKKEYLHRVGPQFDNAIIEMEKLAKRLEPEAERLKDAIRSEAVDELFERICKSEFAFQHSEDGPGMCIELADIENIAERMKSKASEQALIEEVDYNDR